MPGLFGYELQRHVVVLTEQLTQRAVVVEALRHIGGTP